MQLKNLIKLTVLLICITGCVRTNFSDKDCYKNVNYTKDDKLKLSKALERVNEPVIDRYITDYGNIREKIRKCNQ